LRLDADHRARYVQDVAHAQLVRVAHEAVRGHATVALRTHVVGPEPETVEEVHRGVGEPLEVVGDRQMLDDVGFPGEHRSPIRIDPRSAVHGHGL
jgi:hypothetical protein